MNLKYMTGKNFLYIVIATFITIMVWVVVDIIHQNSSVQIPAEITDLIKPINPNFDSEVINAL